MLHVGLTGNAGAGKSSVAALFARWGASVIDSDELARECVRPGSAVLAKIREVFGDGVLGADGGLDRAAMRSLAFSDAGAREQLEAILHPAIRARYRELLGEARARGDAIVIGVVPLLYETGMEGDFDLVVLVDAPLEVRVGRLVEKRGLAAAEARALVAAQMPAEEKRARAAFIIDNDSDLTTLERRAWETWKQIERLGGTA
jgi:dephospho-CoA kinase